MTAAMLVILLCSGGASPSSNLEGLVLRYAVEAGRKVVKP